VPTVTCGISYIIHSFEFFTVSLLSIPPDIQKLTILYKSLQQIRWCQVFSLLNT